MIDIRDYSCKQKYRGTTNRKGGTKASFSTDGACLVCGSDNGKVYVWDTSSDPVDTLVKRKKKRVKPKCLKVSNGEVKAVFAPSKPDVIVGASGNQLKVFANNSLP